MIEWVPSGTVSRPMWLFMSVWFATSPGVAVFREGEVMPAELRASSESLHLSVTCAGETVSDRVAQAASQAQRR